MNGTDIGEQMRHAREERGLSLGDTARMTKLSPSILRAIERNDFDSLPAGVYRKAYLRTLAAEVGLDPLQVAVDYEKQCAAVGEAPTTAPATPPPRNRWLPPRRTIFAVIVAALLLVAWFALQLDRDPVSSRPVAQVGLNR